MYSHNEPTIKEKRKRTNQSFVKMAVSGLSSLETDENEDKYGSQLLGKLSSYQDSKDRAQNGKAFIHEAGEWSKLITDHISICKKPSEPNDSDIVLVCCLPQFIRFQCWERQESGGQEEKKQEEGRIQKQHQERYVILIITSIRTCM